MSEDTVRALAAARAGLAHTVAARARREVRAASLASGAEALLAAAEHAIALDDEPSARRALAERQQLKAQAADLQRDIASLQTQERRLRLLVSHCEQGLLSLSG